MDATVARAGGRATSVRPAPSAQRRDTRLAPATGVAVVAAWGAGLIATALGAAGVTGGSAATVVCGVLLLVLGAAALVWGGVSLARGAIVTAGITTAGALVLPVVLAAAVATDPGRLSIIGAAAGTGLSVAVGLLAAASRRTAAAPDASARTQRRGGLAVFLVAAVLTAAVVTPALSAVQDAQLRPGQTVDMGDMGMNMHMGGH